MKNKKLKPYEKYDHLSLDDQFKAYYIEDRKQRIKSTVISNVLFILLTIFIIACMLLSLCLGLYQVNFSHVKSSLVASAEEELIPLSEAINDRELYPYGELLSIVKMADYDDFVDTYYTASMEFVAEDHNSKFLGSFIGVRLSDGSSNVEFTLYPHYYISDSEIFYSWYGSFDYNNSISSFIINLEYGNYYVIVNFNQQLDPSNLVFSLYDLPTLSTSELLDHIVVSETINFGLIDDPRTYDFVLLGSDNYPIIGGGRFYYDDEAELNTEFSDDIGYGELFLLNTDYGSILVFGYDNIASYNNIIYGSLVEQPLYWSFNDNQSELTSFIFLNPNFTLDSFIHVDSFSTIGYRKTTSPTNVSDSLGSIMGSSLNFTTSAITSSFTQIFDTIFTNGSGEISTYTTLIVWFSGVAIALGFFKYILRYILTLGGKR